MTHDNIIGDLAAIFLLHSSFSTQKALLQFCEILSYIASLTLDSVFPWFTPHLLPLSPSAHQWLVPSNQPQHKSTSSTRQASPDWRCELRRSSIDLPEFCAFSVSLLIWSCLFLWPSGASAVQTLGPPPHHQVLPVIRLLFPAPLRLHLPSWFQQLRIKGPLSDHVRWTTFGSVLPCYSYPEASLHVPHLFFFLSGADGRKSKLILPLSYLFLSVLFF